MVAGAAKHNGAVRWRLRCAFAFFSKAENLGLLTPAAMRFSITERAPAVGEDTTIEYRLRFWTS